METAKERVLNLVASKTEDDHNIFINSMFIVAGMQALLKEIERGEFVLPDITFKIEGKVYRFICWEELENDPLCELG